MDDPVSPGRNGAETDQTDAPDASSEAADAASTAAGMESAAESINAVRGLVEQLLEEGLSRVRGEGGKLGMKASQTVSGMMPEFGVAQRRDHEDLELRIAQLEHRVQLLEGARDAASPTTSSSNIPPGTDGSLPAQPSGDDA